MSDIKKGNCGKPIKIGKKYFIKIGGEAYPHNQGKVRRVLREAIHYDFTIENLVEDVAQGSRLDHVCREDLISLKGFKYQVGDKVKVKKSYEDVKEYGKLLAGTEQTILDIDDYDDEESILITAPHGYVGTDATGLLDSSFWIAREDIKIVSRPLK